MADIKRHLEFVLGFRNLGTGSAGLLWDNLVFYIPLLLLFFIQDIDWHGGFPGGSNAGIGRGRTASALE
jgi:hypothetical protein